MSGDPSRRRHKRKQEADENQLPSNSTLTTEGSRSLGKLSNVRKLAPLGDVTNTLHLSGRKTARKTASLVADTTPVLGEAAEDHPTSVEELLSLCYNNMLTANSVAQVSDHHSPNVCPDVGEWLKSSYNNLLSSQSCAAVPEWLNMVSSPIARHATVLSADATHTSHISTSTPKSENIGNACNPALFGENNQSVCLGNQSAVPIHNPSNDDDGSTSFQLSSVSADVISNIASEFQTRRWREKYSNLSSAQKNARREQMRQYSRIRRVKSQNVQDPYDSVYKDLPESHHVLKPVPACRFCNAKRFQYESPGFCCRSGKIHVATPNVPDELRRLFTSEDDDSKYFRVRIRRFNSHFSFTSLGASVDKDLASSKDGIYTFRIQGHLYHKLDNLVPQEHGPRHMQLYFYDNDEDLEHRAQRSPELSIDIISNLLGVLQDNPYVRTFRGLGAVPNIDNYKIELNTSITLDQRVYNAPTASQVAAIWVDGNDPQNCFDRSVVVYGRDGKRTYIKAYHACYDPLSYPLFYPSGETGWHSHIPYVGAPLNERPYCDMPAVAEEDEAEDEDSGSCISARQYYCFKLQIRCGVFNVILYGKRLFQQWVVDMYIKIETMRLDFFGKAATQKLIRADLYKGIIDTIPAGETNVAMVGTLIVLLATFHEGQRDIRRRFMDAMCLVQRFGKPDLFVTMTCNPWWDEIVAELLPGQEPQDRPDLVSKVFKAKLRDINDLIFKHDYFGKVVAYVHVTEFQKRGLPHEHFLLIMDTNYKLTTPDHYDKWISAEIPDKEKYHVLHALVIKHMMHGPCGVLKKDNTCMVGDECKFRYPRKFCNSTQQGKDFYPIYRRRDDGRRETVRKAELDNRWVVPYNPGLLMRYNCHINVEACSSIKAVKYLFKYIYKGHDKASFTLDDVRAGAEVNEIKQYRDARFVSPPEALWRIYGFDLFEQSPPVLQLQLHLPDQQPVTFRQGEDLRDVLNKESSSRTMLTEYFRMNRECSYARNFLYKEFPEKFVWNTDGENKRWDIRKQRIQLGRIVQANPKEKERFYLRLLLNHKTGATSFEDLRTVNGELCATFQLAAEKMGILEADTTLDDCLTEVATFQMPSGLRRLFATILVFCEATNIRDMWNNHLESMSEDIRRHHTDSRVVEQLVLTDIRDLLHSMEKNIRDFDLPECDETICPQSDELLEVTDEMSIAVDPEHLQLYESLNTEQRAAFDEIIGHVIREEGRVFFVDGPGGTGKTYLWNALLARIRSLHKIAIATATSGIAASIMPGGRTAHSRFKIPINLAEKAMCSFTRQGGTAELLRKAKLIIWDEVAMTKRQAVETLDRSLQDVMGYSLPFGGKVMLFGGDFRQVLPVVRKGTRAQITDATLLRSYLWENIRQIRLTRNMRAHDDPWFSDFLLRIDNGTEESIGDEHVRLPDEIVIPFTDTNSSINRLIDHIFPSLEQNARSPSYMSVRAILATKNEYVDQLNCRMIGKFPGQEKVYYSFDSVEEDSRNLYTMDFLNSLTPNGLPPHLLKVKVNCPVILLRNLDPNNGLSNGTRLMVKAFQNNAIDAEIVVGQHAGKRVFIPRIPLSPSEDLSLPFKFKRK